MPIGIRYLWLVSSTQLPSKPRMFAAIRILLSSCRLFLMHQRQAARNICIALASSNNFAIIVQIQRCTHKNCHIWSSVKISLYSSHQSSIVDFIAAIILNIMLFEAIQRHLMNLVLFVQFALFNGRLIFESKDIRCISYLKTNYKLYAREDWESSANSKSLVWIGD